MKLLHGETAGREVSGRIAGSAATTTAMAAIPADRRDDAMVVVVRADYSLWVFEAASVVTPSATVIAPAAGSGRWHRVAVAAAS